MRDGKIRFTEDQLRRVIREHLTQNFQGFRARDPSDPSQLVGVDTHSMDPLPMTATYSEFCGKFDDMGGALLDDESMRQLYDDYTSGVIGWEEVQDAAMS